MVKHPKELFMCKYNERWRFCDTGDRLSVHCLGQYRISTSSSNTPRPTPTWPKCNSHATGQPLAGTHSLQAKANTEVLNRTITWTSTLFLHASDHNSDYCTFLLYAFAYISRSHQISKHAQILNKQHIISLYNVTNLCYMVLLIYSVPQEIYITYNQHTMKPFGQSQRWSYIFQLYHTHFLCSMCRYRATTNRFSFFSSQPILARKLCPSGFSLNLVWMSCD